MPQSESHSRVRKFVMSVYRQLAERQVARQRTTLGVNNNLGHLPPARNAVRNMIKGIRQDALRDSMPGRRMR